MSDYLCNEFLKGYNVVFTHTNNGAADPGIQGVSKLEWGGVGGNFSQQKVVLKCKAPILKAQVAATIQHFKKRKAQ